MLFKAGSGNVAFDSQSRAEPGTTALIDRKIWLPKAAYDALPWFYLLAGVAALLATLYISAWFWILPHYFLFSAICLHLSFIVFRRRLPRKPDTDQSEYVQRKTR